LGARSPSALRTQKNRIIQFGFFIFYAFGAAFAAAFLTLAGRHFPNEPLEILPFLVLISPLPIVIHIKFEM
jgi:hypothetical protein